VSVDRGSQAAASNGTPLPTDADDLERAIEQRRAHLAATVDELAARARPAEIARRTKDGAVDRFRAATALLTGLVLWRRISAAGDGGGGR
jgi:hypothetical protein